MKALKWVGIQMSIMTSSWLFAATWMAMLFWMFEVEALIFWLAGAIAAAVLPLISFLESLIMLLVRRHNRMSFLDSLLTAVVLVLVPLLGGYFYVVGECVECEPTIATFTFAALVFGVPAAMAQNVFRRLFARV
jgi:hypothetical protein